ncbi:hypothetical protein F4780DRAFT_765948 [Xylariomycetidae sp. FL0641]|nr:hypothetical protein F4780DRAFT_765948 [Xylariomycetidae sp. FL0641]
MDSASFARYAAAFVWLLMSGLGIGMRVVSSLLLGCLLWEPIPEYVIFGTLLGFLTGSGWTFGSFMVTAVVASLLQRSSYGLWVYDVVMYVHFAVFREQDEAVRAVGIGSVVLWAHYDERDFVGMGVMLALLLVYPRAHGWVLDAVWWAPAAAVNGLVSLAYLFWAGLCYSCRAVREFFRSDAAAGRQAVPAGEPSARASAPVVQAPSRSPSPVGGLSLPSPVPSLHHPGGWPDENGVLTPLPSPVLSPEQSAPSPALSDLPGAWQSEERVLEKLVLAAAYVHSFLPSSSLVFILLTLVVSVCSALPTSPGSEIVIDNFEGTFAVPGSEYDSDEE